MMKRILTAAALAAALFGGTALAAPPTKPVTVKGTVAELIDGTVTVQMTLTATEKDMMKSSVLTEKGKPSGPGRIGQDKGEIFGRWRVDARDPELQRELAKLKGAEVVLEFARGVVVKVERAKP